MVHPKIIFDNGKPSEVILPLEDYEAMLERLEQIEDLQAIREMKDRDWERLSLEDFQAGRDVEIQS